MICSIVQVRSTPTMISNCRDLSDRVSTMMKIREDNYVTNSTNAIYVETKLSCHDRSNRVW